MNIKKLVLHTQISSLLKEWHRLSMPLEATFCPLCSTSVHILELMSHLTVAHSVTPPATGNALLLWILTSNQMRKTLLQNPMHSAMLLQSMLPGLKAPALPPSLHAPHPSSGSPVVTPTNSLVATPPINSTPPLAPVMPPTSSSFLQSLLNGDPPRAPPPSHLTPPTMMTSAINGGSIDMSKLEHVVGKLTRKHMGLNARESYQCQVCSKWFAVPPIKHLRGHLVTFREEQRPYIGLINNNGYACLSCYFIASSPHEITEHVTSHCASLHHPSLQPLAPPTGSSPNDSIAASPKGSTGGTDTPPLMPVTPPTNGRTPRPSGVPTIIADPKGVELDNAGRVKSGKVRKQCELCGQWSNIKWFFKHMSECHNALFCRCCREYLPIHEQEEHRKFHAEPPYMGQKIRIENGQPIIIDRKERASLTPIGNLTKSFNSYSWNL